MKAVWIVSYAVVLLATYWSYDAHNTFLNGLFTGVLIGLSVLLGESLSRKDQ